MHTQGHTHNTHTDLQTGILREAGTEKESCRQKSADGGEAWAEPDYSEKAGRAVREWGYWDNRRRGPEWAMHPKSRKLQEKSLACVSSFTVRR